MRRIFAVAIVFTLCVCCSCQRAPQDAQSSPETNGADRMMIKLSSSAFQDGDMIPALYTCDGSNVSPPLAWTNVPDKTKTLALVCDDPDAPNKTWVHWVIYNLPANTKELAANISTDATLTNGARQGTNDFKKIGYGGPCPPSGTHRYYFKIYALNAELNLSPGASKDDLLKAMYGHIIDQGQLMGRYQH